MPAGVERAKLEWLREHLPDLVAEGRRVLVFSQFTEMLDSDCR
jgi:SNF2 family DNA or RNA helicase